MTLQSQESVSDEDYSSFLNQGEGDDDYSSEEFKEIESDDELEPEAETEEEPEEEEGGSEETESEVLDIDGEQVKLDDLKSVYKKSTEYEKLTNEVSELKGRIVERASNIQRVYDNLNSYIQSLVPPEPSMTLLQQNPTEYILAQETRKKIIEELDGVIKQRDDIGDEIQKINHDDFLVLKNQQETKFKNRLPEFKSEGKFKEFQDNFKKIGSELGFSQDEIDNCVDSRLWELMHYAGIGKQVIRAKKDFNAKAYEKRIAAKPFRKTTNQFASIGNQSKNKVAFDRLRKTGSINDALKLDFD